MNDLNALKVMYCMLIDDIDFDTFHSLQEHLHNVYVGKTRSCYVEQYRRTCRTRAERWNRVTYGGWGPLLEHDDIVSLAIQLFIVRNVRCCIC